MITSNITTEGTNVRGVTVIGKPCSKCGGVERYAGYGRCVSCTRKRSKYKNFVGKMLWSSMARAKRANREFTLTREWIQERMDAGVCELTGIRFDLIRQSRRTAYTPSIDRIDNSKGYTPENCRIILWALNSAFGTWGEDVLRTIVTAWLKKGALQ